MLYDAVCHANLQSVIRYPYPIRICGIVENDIRIYPYPQKFTDIRKSLCAVPYPRTSAYACNANDFNLSCTVYKCRYDYDYYLNTPFVK